MKFPRSQFPDFWIRLTGSLIASHLVESLGRTASVIEQMFSETYWSALLSGWAIGYFIWTLVAVVSSELDKKIDWIDKTTRRVLVQIAVGVIVPALLLLILSWVQVKILWGQDIIENGYHITEFPFSILIIVLVNGIYFAWYLYNKLRTPEKLPAAVESPAPQISYLNVLMVSSANVQVPVAVKSILFIQKQGDYSIIKTFDKSFVSSASLDELENNLDPQFFFRANRQVIVHVNVCKAIKSLPYGKLAVQTDPAMEEPLVVSQKKARAFKDWMANR